MGGFEKIETGRIRPGPQQVPTPFSAGRRVLGADSVAGKARVAKIFQKLPWLTSVDDALAILVSTRAGLSG